LKEVCWRLERGEVTSASAIVAFIGAVSQAMNKLPKADYCDVVRL
jgi:hypothetical protein